MIFIIFSMIIIYIYLLFIFLLLYSCCIIFLGFTSLIFYLNCLFVLPFDSLLFYAMPPLFWVTSSSIVDQNISFSNDGSQIVIWNVDAKKPNNFSPGVFTNLLHGLQKYHLLYTINCWNPTMSHLLRYVRALHVKTPFRFVWIQIYHVLASWFYVSPNPHLLLKFNIEQYLHDKIQELNHSLI